MTPAQAARARVAAFIAARVSVTAGRTPGATLGDELSSVVVKHAKVGADPSMRTWGDEADSNFTLTLGDLETLVDPAPPGDGRVHRAAELIRDASLSPPRASVTVQVMPEHVYVAVWIDGEPNRLGLPVEALRLIVAEADAIARG